jgi:hypothetical protein
MKKSPYFVLLVVMLVSACIVPGLAAATPTPVPANTQRPTQTFTPEPTDTPIPSPTATPDVAATEAANATQAAGDTLSELDKVLGKTDIPYKEGHLVWKQADPVTLEMLGPDREIIGIDEEVTAGNFILQSEVTWESTGLLVCGAIFRSEEDVQEGKQYQFVFLRFSGLPAWSIEVHEFGQFRNTFTKTKFSDMLDLSNGATNQFILVAQAEHFTIYFNNIRQGTYYDYSNQRTEGTIGFVGYQDSGEGTCTFENTWLWTLPSDTE